MANKKYARIINGAAIDVTDDPKASFHPTIAAQFIEVPASVVIGSRVDAKGQWSDPIIEASTSEE